MQTSSSSLFLYVLMNYKCKEEEQFWIFTKFVVEVGRKISFFWGEGKRERD